MRPLQATTPPPPVEVIDELQGRLRSALLDLEGHYADDLLHDRLSEGLGGCCGVTKQDFKGGATVVRGPDWKWSDQDGGAGNTGILAQSLDSDGWVSVHWTGGGSNRYRVATAQDLRYHSSVLDTVSCSGGDDVQLARTCAARHGPDGADHEGYRQHCVQRQSQRGRALELHHASALSRLHYTEETTEAAALTPDMRGGVSQTEFPKGWTQLQETAYQKLIAAGTKQAMTTDLVRKSLKGEHGEKPSEIHQKSHIVDCELVVEALKKMRGPIPGRQYFAYLAETLQQEDNWRWLKDIKNQVNDHVVVKKVLSGEKVKLSPHETSKVAKQVAFLLNNKDKLPRALVKSMVEVLDKAYQEKTLKKILDRRKFPEFKDTKSTSTLSNPMKADGTPDMRYTANRRDDESSDEDFRGSACYAVSSNPTGPIKADGTPDMRYTANRRDKEEEESWGSDSESEDPGFRGFFCFPIKHSTHTVCHGNSDF